MNICAEYMCLVVRPAMKVCGNKEKISILRVNAAILYYTVYYIIRNYVI